MSTTCVATTPTIRRDRLQGVRPGVENGGRGRSAHGRSHPINQRLSLEALLILPPQQYLQQQKFISINSTMKLKIAVVDYGMGNLRSVSKALEHVAPSAQVDTTDSPDVILAADKVVFPGQGHT